MNRPQWNKQPPRTSLDANPTQHALFLLRKKGFEFTWSLNNFASLKMLGMDVDIHQKRFSFGGVWYVLAGEV